MQKQKLPVDGIDWVKDLSRFNKIFTKNYDENSAKGYILEVGVEYPKNYLIFIVIYRFYPKERKSENVISLFVPYKTKKTMLFT